MTRHRLALLHPIASPESTVPDATTQLRQQPSPLERLVTRLARERDAYAEGSEPIPAAEVVALLGLLETQARAVLGEVGHG